MPVLFPRAWPNTVINHWMLDSSPSSNQTTALDSVKHKLAIMSVQCEHVQVYIFCRMFNLSSVSLYCKWFFVPKLKWSCMSASVPSNAGPHLQRRSEQPGDEWAAKFSSRRWQPPTGSGEAPCMTATGSYSAPFDEKPRSPDSVCSSAPFLLLVFFFPVLIQARKQV